MKHNPANDGIELSAAELATIQGGGIFDWIDKHVFKPIMYAFRGGRPAPPYPDWRLPNP